jgi:hypothetical protein
MSEVRSDLHEARNAGGDRTRAGRHLLSVRVAEVLADEFALVGMGSAEGLAARWVSGARMGLKLIFASPSDGSPIAEEVVIGQRLAIMHAQKHAGVDWVAECSPQGVKQSTIDAIRNRVVKEALQHPADAIFWCDSDIVLPPHAVTALVLARRVQPKATDFVCGIYHQRGAAMTSPAAAR